MSSGFLKSTCRKGSLLSAEAHAIQPQAKDASQLHDRRAGMEMEEDGQAEGGHYVSLADEEGGGESRHEEEKEKKKEHETRGGNLTALALVRFVAAIHIVCFHTGIQAAPDSVHWVRFCKYGPTWVTFFFILSGFVQVYSRMTGPRKTANKPPNVFWFCAQRLATVVPAYLVSLLAHEFLKSRVEKDYPSRFVSGPQVWQHWWNMLCQVLMVKTWWPPLTLFKSLELPGDPQDLNYPAHFISSLFLFWILFPGLYWIVLRLEGWVVGVALCGCYWYQFLVKFHLMGLMSRLQVDNFGYMPLCFVNQYFLGMLIAKIFVEARQQKQSQTEGREPMLAERRERGGVDFNRRGAQCFSWGRFLSYADFVPVLLFTLLCLFVKEETALSGTLCDYGLLPVWSLMIV
uniref:Acyltransferase 3 domain-containing protein n=1 Tax=Chromera velia CCMP2878 TaxID=1169474 RepID=A0A0G4GY08_9ALVE|eukprot:Cvel_5374.t1-p1 / transcript=Cvel_5374.t1 / gene=Cvel_5374 / organism=Chromera_velia_CCMP2878 / gene_product=hypothetical protein / transcript_product=hypothetical protein / location=Cvel_scaffold249:82266-83468(+) / protein_length=401 / sequence_SO=supercontig / SO=protein_coding / is_pseudo=false